MILGIDVSRWQDNNSTAQKMDFVKAFNQGARFVFIKGSQGLWKDEDIEINWNSAKEVGFLRGAYHFLDWVTSPILQARYAWSVIKDDPGELPPVIDFEYWGTVPNNAYDLLWQYVVEMEKLSGKKPIIYTGAFFWNEYSTQSNIWTNYPVWIASYSDQNYMQDNLIRLTPWYDWTFWQFTDKGDGLLYGAESLQLDMNYFNGTMAELYRFCGMDPQEPLPEPLPEPVTGKVTLKVVRAVKIRTGASILQPQIGLRSVGELVTIREIAVVNALRVWVRDDIGWSAVIQDGVIYMKEK